MKNISKERGYKQGSTLRVNLWPQASKNSQKQLRASKKIPQLVLQGQQTFGDILVKKFTPDNVPKCFSNKWR